MNEHDTGDQAETDAILSDPDTMAAIVEAAAEQGPVPAALAQAADDSWDLEHANEPPSPAADLLDTMITDMDRLGDNTAHKFGKIADTQPGGIGEAAVHVHDTVTNADHVIVCVPARLATEMAQDADLAARLWEMLAGMAETLKGWEVGPYPSPAHISYDPDSRWCQDHGHTGLLVSGPGTGAGCGICDRLVQSDPRFAAALADHNPDGSRKRKDRP
jgi:hypothetical protein